MRNKGNKGQRGGSGRAYVPHKEVVPLLAAWGNAGNDVTEVDDAVQHLRDSYGQFKRKTVSVVRQLVERALKDPALYLKESETRLRVSRHVARMHACSVPASESAAVMLHCLVEQPRTVQAFHRISKTDT